MISNLLRKRERDNDYEILQYLDEDVQVKGRNHILMERHEYSALQEALRCKRSRVVIYKLIEVGGRELVMANDSLGQSTMYTAIMNKASNEIISKLIEVGGRELVMETYFYGETTLHTACANQTSIDIISKLVDVGGRELVMKTYIKVDLMHCILHV